MPNALLFLKEKHSTGSVIGKVASTTSLVPSSTSAYITGDKFVRVLNMAKKPHFLQDTSLISPSLRHPLQKNLHAVRAERSLFCTISKHWLTFAVQYKDMPVIFQMVVPFSDDSLTEEIIRHVCTTQNKTKKPPMAIVFF